MSLDWTKSTFSGGEKTCVEIAHRADSVLMRDSKYTGPAVDQPIISVAAEEWSAVLELALDRSSGSVRDALTITVHPDGSAVVRDNRGIMLSYNTDEWDAFAKGVADNQFDRP
ncbi:DUF397 domain-containing protein [Nocardia macrotermitis]|uniref:DUF397 domain-containing protein n=1 Tax=Nocardia macrotermitis TaxID=2585198 RepID=UPI0029E7EFF9|nr:DUF397 domain-containing protein [Nocardia macrotermitis]